MLPVMLGALVSMLQGFAALHYLTIGFPIAITCAMGWTWIKVRGDICEIHIHDESVAIRSLMDAALPSSELQWKRLLHVEAESSHADLTLGLSTIRLTQSDWPEWTHILRALLRARTTR